MLFKGLLATALSGRLDGLVASHNAGGTYFRNFVVPTNPNTPQQIQIRNQVSNLTSIWQSTLTQFQRDEWDVFADNVTITNRVGDQINISGLAMFVRNNTSRVQIAEAIQIKAPAIFNQGSASLATMSNAIESATTVDFNFSISPISDPWAAEVGSFMLFYLSRPQNTGIKYFRGPYRFAGSIQGDPVPPTSPITLVAGFSFVAGQRLFGTSVVIREDGRYTKGSREVTVLTVP